MNIAKYIDHTVLKQTTTIGDVTKVCEEAGLYGFAAVCIPPLYVKKAKELLKDSRVEVCTVIGFPFGYSAIEAKVAEIVLAMVDGVDELDMVADIPAIKNGDWSFIANEINTVMPLVKEKKKVIKIIIESGVLTDDEIIKCCSIYGTAGVDYVKTSTGYGEAGATIEAVRLIRANLPADIKIKAAGGIRSFALAKQLIAAGANRIGCSRSLKIIEEEKEFMNKV